MKRLGTALAVLLLVLLAAPAHATLPSKQVWLRNVRSALAGVEPYVAQRTAGGGERLALVLDIDNTSIASHYAWPQPARPTLAVARYAVAHGMTVFFVTGRTQRDAQSIRAVLARAGYVFAGVCGRTSLREGLVHGKQRCRAALEAQGYKVALDIGNHRTDVRGSDIEKKMLLPSYDNQLS